MEKKVRGEYGEVLASIDVDRLNVCLEEAVKELKAPVEVNLKQFKVCCVPIFV